MNLRFQNSFYVALSPLNLAMEVLAQHTIVSQNNIIEQVSSYCSAMPNQSIYNISQSQQIQIQAGLI